MDDQFEYPNLGERNVTKKDAAKTGELNTVVPITMAVN
jgi:hypothetical protein